MRYKRCKLLLYLCAGVFFSMGCANSKDGKEVMGGEVKYYASFSGYSIPLKPQQEISEIKAKSMLSYCIGYYDKEGKLYRFEKYYEGKLFFSHEYTYHVNGNVKESKVIDPEGVKKITLFDEKGVAY